MNRVQRSLLKIAGLSWLVDAANPIQRYQRPFEPMTVGPTHYDVSTYDRQILISDSLKLYNNLGPVKGALNDKSVYAIGRAWDAKSQAKDRDWAKEAEYWVNKLWYPTCDVRGSSFDFKTDLYLASLSVDREGEIFVLLTSSQDGQWPQIQLIPTRMIGSRNLADDTLIKDGPYAGMRMLQGVVVNDRGCPAAFLVLGNKPENDTYYSARDCIQVFEPESVDQVHGFPGMSHAILDLKDLRTVQGYERIAAMLMSQVGLIENNELGAPDASDPSVLLNKTGNFGPTEPNVITQEERGVTTRFFRAGSGGSLSQLKSERPGAAVSDFMDRLIRNGCSGFGWPYELTWDPSKLGGANVRLLVARGMRTVEDRQDLIKPVARRAVGYAVAKAISLGLLKPNPEWYAWDFTLPPRLSSDYGRDANADRADYEANITTMTDILAEDGIQLEDHIAKLQAERKALAEAGITPISPSTNERPQV